jgi:hypothetical protein
VGPAAVGLLSKGKLVNRQTVLRDSAEATGELGLFQGDVGTRRRRAAKACALRFKAGVRIIPLMFFALTSGSARPVTMALAERGRHC